ncbi:single-stranded DNA-binding protein [Nocardioides sp. CER19]|uniref:single-stranded DNA-binding protein n=1 Tax=Nocardioides sp. CER19 TaxID=3038538 RepID=UPI002447E740|nr:single-stranded DNA-binding protein [Nocardioides sp. CER19]MDH2415562.1 single-stranded DNA-binding protein [Nocardioides sp. CER19]
MAAKSAEVATVNEVRLVGRVSGAPETRTMPSGDDLVSFRLVVDRTEGAYRGKQRVDVLDCVVWDGRRQRTVGAWSTGDVVEVTGEVRRRFYRAPNGTGSRVEIEVRTARLIRRASSA